jgi:hypothetical protein
MRHVLVNGVPIRLDEEQVAPDEMMTLPGRVLRSGSD